MNKTLVLIIYGECNNDYIIDCYYNSVKSYFNGTPTHECCCVKVKTSEDLKNEIEIICNKLSDQDNLYLDIQCHGDNTGLSFSRNNFISWQQLYDLCKQIHSRTKNIYMVLSSCYSFGFAAYLHNNKLNDACRCLLCTSNTEKGLNLTETLESIFSKIFNEGCMIQDAVEHSNRLNYITHEQNNYCPLTIFEMFVFDTN